MSTNKNAQLRYKVLDNCFRNNGRKYFIDDLVDACNDVLLDENPDGDGVKKRQVQEDIKYMESENGFQASIERHKDGRRVYYRYEDVNFSIYNSDLSSAEGEKLKVAMNILSKFKGLPQFEQIQEIIPILEDKIGLLNNSKEIIHFDANIDYSGIKNIEPFYNAINNKRVLEVEYQDFKSDEPYKLVFHPYVLKQFNNRWFCFGLNGENQVPTWNLALDRVLNVKELGGKYIEDEIDWDDDYFADIIGVTRFSDREIETIELEFSPMRAGYVISKPLHQTQTKPIEQEGGWVKISLKVIPNNELIGMILSFGKDVRVIGPASFKEKVSEEIKLMTKNY